ncbi:unnamed protein product [Schistosoma mattheei]|uniref:Uncharacterized protein n=1 Tax=Schistosoma mattheei TaxID=31246 RepID=A0A183PN37_9TREM|nr:unnamed protein product [Schistosoma mattheei]
MTGGSARSTKLQSATSFIIGCVYLYTVGVPGAAFEQPHMLTFIGDLKPHSLGYLKDPLSRKIVCVCANCVFDNFF